MANPTPTGATPSTSTRPISGGSARSASVGQRYALPSQPGLRPTEGEEAGDSVDDLAAFIAASPSPFHATANLAAALREAGFVDASAIDAAWTETPTEASGLPRSGFIRRAGAIIAWSRPAGDPQFGLGFRILGAHSDSPNLRLRPHADRPRPPWLGAGVEVYGGALLNSWLDRDLGVSGRVFTRPRGSSDQLATLLVRSDEPLMRVPQLAIHLDRAVREGLVLNPQEHLQPIWGYGQAGATLDLIAQALNTRGEVIEESPGSPGTPVTKPLDTGDIEGFDLMLHPAEAPRRIGAPDHTGQPQLLASARLDNLMSCWAAGAAMIETEVERSAPPDGREGPGAPTAVMAIFDAEEVGSETMTGAGGRLLEQVLTALCGGDALLLGNTLARSVALSMDMSHAVHPNYPDRHDPAHVVQPGAGPAIKVNASQRYSTSGAGIAYLRTLAADAGIPVQVYSHRGDLPCGSTIGPILATRLSVPTIDIGAPQLSMHSARELMACTDVAPTAQLAAAFLRRRVGPPCS